MFDGTNKHDIMYAVKYCKDRGIKHHVLNLSYRKMLEETIPDAIKHGEFTHSYSQIALTNIFSYIKDDETVVFLDITQIFTEESVLVGGKTLLTL